MQDTNKITFNDEDIEVGYSNHRRPLYLAASIIQIPIKRALVDTSASVNLIPHNTLQAVGIPESKIQGCPIVRRKRWVYRRPLLWLKVGPIAFSTHFHVVKTEVSYHILLERPWLHKHHLILSTYHQYMKGRLNDRMMRITTNPSPFEQVEAHLVEIMFYDEWAPSGESSISKPQGTFVPKWEDI